MEVEGPLNETWPPPSHRAIFGDLPQVKTSLPNQSDRVEVASDEPLKHAERILRGFARRAFRRPVTDGELAPYLALVKAKLAEQRSFEQAVRADWRPCSPPLTFFFSVKRRASSMTSPSPVRLSYFLWSTMPDEELLALAEQGELHEPAVLRGAGRADAQATRRRRPSRENFAGQWLGLRDIDATEPSQFALSRIRRHAEGVDGRRRRNCSSTKC